jgi:hypothetical protein
MWKTFDLTHPCMCTPCFSLLSSNRSPSSSLAPPRQSPSPELVALVAAARSLLDELIHTEQPAAHALQRAIADANYAWLDSALNYAREAMTTMVAVAGADASGSTSGSADASGSGTSGAVNASGSGSGSGAMARLERLILAGAALLPELRAINSLQLAVEARRIDALEAALALADGLSVASPLAQGSAAATAFSASAEAAAKRAAELKALQTTASELLAALRAEAAAVAAACVAIEAAMATSDIDALSKLVLDARSLR